MAHLDRLKVSNRVILAARPRHKADAVEYRRNKLIANLEEQIELAELAIAGKPPQIKRKRGHEVVTVRPRLWWVTDENGDVATVIRYNGVPLEIRGRGTTIEVGKLRQLPAVYRTVIRAVKAGELDRAVETVRLRQR